VNRFSLLLSVSALVVTGVVLSAGAQTPPPAVRHDPQPPQQKDPVLQAALTHIATLRRRPGASSR